MNAPHTEDTATRHRQCYLCIGTQTIEVTIWRGEDQVLVPTTCVRCRGTGVITDGFDLQTLSDVNQAALRRRRYDDCICDFPVDGPMGNPNCPAR